MKAVEFAYWLQGYFEIQGGNPVLTEAQLKTVKKRAEGVQAGQDGAEAKANSFVSFALGMFAALPDQADTAALAKVSQTLQTKLNDLFQHAIDPSYSGNQTAFNDAHNGGGFNPGPGIRC